MNSHIKAIYKHLMGLSMVWLLSTPLCSEELRTFFIDPGHGGTKVGCITLIPDYYEKHVNMDVAWELFSLLDNPPLQFMDFDWTYEYSRNQDTTVDNADRATMANQCDAYLYLSIHHNSSASSISSQRSEVYYDSDSLIRGTEIPRNGTDALAAKVGLRLRDYFGYDIRSPLQHDYDVLALTIMPSALSEASFIYDSAQSDITTLEAQLFYYDCLHTQKEAYALFTAMISYKRGGGLGKVEYAYLKPQLTPISSPPTVYIDTSYYPERLYSVPVDACWLEGEWCRFQANDFVVTIPQYGDPDSFNYNYTFHHWERKWHETGWNFETNYDRVWLDTINFDFDSIHYYIAYFTGGPYKLYFQEDSSTVRDVCVGDTIYLEWQCSGGIDDTTTHGLIELYRNANWEEIYNWKIYLPEDTMQMRYTWTVSGDYATGCYFRFTASDSLGNQATTSSRTFSIFNPELDGDSDMVVDSLDNCPFTYNPAPQTDDDEDGVGDSCDICIYIYNPGPDPAYPYLNQLDSDFDFVGDPCDNCPTVANPGPLAHPQDQLDTDHDGFGDFCDNCISVYNPSQVNSDTDSLGDACDNCPYVDNIIYLPVTPYYEQPDQDEDGVGDACDNCLTVYNSDQENSDSDTLGDACDNCINADNNDQIDSDNDGFGDSCDVCPGYNDNIDYDNDGWPNACDNCIFAFNSDQADGDVNNFGDSCDCYGFIDSTWFRVFTTGSDNIFMDISPTADGGYLATGKAGNFLNNADIFVMKTNQCGQIIRYRSFNVTDGGIGKSVFPTSDLGCIIGGSNEVSFGNPGDMFAMKLDSNFNTVWANAYDPGEACEAVIQSIDNCYILAGWKDHGLLSGETDGYLVKVDSNGIVIWSRTFDDNHTAIYDIMQIADSGYVLVGKQDSPSGVSKCFVARTDLLGYTIWQGVYGDLFGHSGDSLFDEAYSLDTTYDGGIVVAGKREYLGYDFADFLIVKVDGNGNHIWTSTCGDSLTDFAYSVHQLQDGNIIVGGYSNSFSPGYFSPYICKIGQNGSVYSEYIHSVGNDIRINDMEISSDRKYIVAGSSNDDFYISKIIPSFICGDCNGDGSVNAGDVVFIVCFVFENCGDPRPPDPLEAGDVNCDGLVNVGDAVYMINYIFKYGPAPCANCP